MTALDACEAEGVSVTLPLACGLVHAPAHWPEVQLLLITHPSGDELSEASRREAARQHVRALLRRHAGAAIADPFLAAPRGARGAGRVSISHERGVSLLAWCAHGRVGVDIVDLQSIAQTDAKELADLAALYLGPVPLTWPVSTAPAAQRRFAAAWAAHEARLKCLGRELEEWSPSLQAALDGCTHAAIAMPRAHPGAARWTAQLAWRA